MGISVSSCSISLVPAEGRAGSIRAYPWLLFCISLTKNSAYSSHSSHSWFLRSFVVRRRNGKAALGLSWSFLGFVCCTDATAATVHAALRIANDSLVRRR